MFCFPVIIFIFSCVLHNGSKKREFYNSVVIGLLQERDWQLLRTVVKCRRLVAEDKVNSFSSIINHKVFAT